MTEEFIIAGWMDYGPNRDKVLGHFAACARHSRAEPGCLDYTVCADPNDDGRIFVFEHWVSENDLVAHFQTPHIAEFRSAIASYERSGRSLHRHFVSRSEEFQSSRVGQSG
jgi:quinol monooxygenase YgiN